MLKELKTIMKENKKARIIFQQIYNNNKEIEIIKCSQIEILELKYILPEKYHKRCFFK
jgi:hypothetical protein